MKNKQRPKSINKRKTIIQNVKINIQWWSVSLKTIEWFRRDFANERTYKCAHTIIATNFTNFSNRVKLELGLIGKIHPYFYENIN